MPTIQELAAKVAADTTALSAAASTKLGTTAALGLAEAADAAASTNFYAAVAGGNAAQITAAAQMKLQTNAALAAAEAADNSATTAFVNASKMLAEDQAALNAAIVQLIGNGP